jgi:fructokinase
MNPQRGLIVGLGEVLWDLLPAGRQLGGAPFNFTFHCHQLGHPAAMVSRVGADDLGRDIRVVLRERELSDEFVQEDFDHPTGTVVVRLDDKGQPDYTIVEDVAYDHITWQPTWPALFSQAQAVCFGTLVQREPTGEEAVRRAVAAASNALTVYDVNLRQKFFNRRVLEESLRACRWVKLNDDELVVLRDLLQLSGKTEPTTVRALRRKYDVELACLTRGANGCLVQTDDEEVTVAGQTVQVVDTVGAGDAFTAGLLTAVLEGREIAEAAAFANRLAARVASSAGGTPRIDRTELESLRAS